ncbi:hypothetical protein LguiB_024136 [Lonicera macranthoides]
MKFGSTQTVSGLHLFITTTIESKQTYRHAFNSNDKKGKEKQKTNLVSPNQWMQKTATTPNLQSIMMICTFAVSVYKLQKLTKSQDPFYPTISHPCSTNSCNLKKLPNLPIP